jgi:glyoxylate reductase
MSDLPRVYLTRRLPAPVLERLGASVRITQWPGEQAPPRAVLQKELASASGVIAWPNDRFDRAMFEVAPQLRVVSMVGAECENIDVVAATRAGVLVTHTPDLSTESVADFTVALILAASRRLIEQHQFVRNGHWRVAMPDALMGRDLYGSTIGILGFGRVGQAVARRAQAFGMRVIYHSRYPRPSTSSPLAPRYVSFDQLLKESDILSLHCPLSDDTYQIIDHDALMMMKPNAMLINTAHHLLLDTRALTEVLKQKPMVVALDVMDPEPVPADHPLLSMPNVIVTPNAASASQTTRTRMVDAAVDDLLCALHGQRPRYLANPDLWPEYAQAVGEV